MIRSPISRIFTISSLRSMFSSRTLPQMTSLLSTYPITGEQSTPSNSQWDLQFRFKKDHLHLLLKLLSFPDVISCDNRAKMSGEEVFLRGLYELRSGDTQCDCSTNLFGRDCTAQSRAYGWFVKHIYYNFRDLITGNLEWWFRNGFVNESREAIWRKITAVNTQ